MTTIVKYRSNEEIREKADEIRCSPELVGHNIPPIDVFYLAEVILKLDIIPLRNLLVDQHIDAALLPDLSGFYIDEEAYLSWEAGQAWVEQRLRFSFAHELGHYFLHKDEILGNQFRSVEDFRMWAKAREKYANAEYQADEFAGRLLVPCEMLLAAYDGYYMQAQQADPSWREIEGMREHLARKIAPKFGVNHQVIEVRFDREGIWPAE